MAQTGVAFTLKKFVRLLKIEDKLKQQLKKVKSDIEETEPGVLDHFQKMGISKTTVEGITVYIRRQIWAAKNPDVSIAELVKVFKSNDMGEYCEPRLNAQSISAWVREFDERSEELPADIAAVLKVSEVFKLGHRKG